MWKSRWISVENFCFSPVFKAFLAVEKYFFHITTSRYVNK